MPDQPGPGAVNGLDSRTSGDTVGALKMTPRLLLVSFVLGSASTFAAEQPPAAPSAHEILKARIAEEAKAASEKQSTSPAAPAQPAGPAAAQPTTQPTAAPAAPTAAASNPILNPTAANAATTAQPDAGDNAARKDVRSEPATVMPKVEVRRSRINEVDQEIAKQEKDIEREKKNTKSTEADKALNDASIAKPLSIFGGESSQFRQKVASERVSLMEDEKDILEAIAHAKTKEEKAELKKQLNALRAQRRELERTLR